MREPSPPPSAGGRLLVGMLLVAAGAVPVLAAFDVGPFRQAAINGPAWIGFAAGGVFGAAGVALIAGPDRRVINASMVMLVLAGLAALANWVAFGAGVRACTGGFPLIGARDLSGLACRIPFGLGAVMVDAMLGLFAVTTLQRLLGGPPRLARLRTLAERLLLLSLAPILLPVVLVLVASVVLKALKTRLTTGAWPRNQAFVDRQRARGQVGRFVQRAGKDEQQPSERR